MNVKRGIKTVKRKLFPLGPGIKTAAKRAAVTLTKAPKASSSVKISNVKGSSKKMASTSKKGCVTKTRVKQKVKTKPTRSYTKRDIVKSVKSTIKKNVIKPLSKLFRK